MKQETPVFVGVDWAWKEHQVTVLDSEGGVLVERTVTHSGAELAEFASWLVDLVEDPSLLRVAIELPHGAVVETLLERGIPVFAVNPKQLDRFRDRYSPSGAKDDRRDALVLASALRTDPEAFRELVVDDPIIIRLREWSRTLSSLRRERVRHANQLREALRRYFAQVLELSTDVSEPWVLALLSRVPTPAAAKRVRRSTIEKILKQHRIRRYTADEVLAVLRKPSLSVAPGTVDAASATVGLLVERLELLNRQSREAERTLDELTSQFNEMQKERDGQRDAEILLSIPGVGRIVVATLLAEASQPLNARDYQSLRTLCGVAPVTRQSGKARRVLMRQACHERLRDAVYNWARVAVQHDGKWSARYSALRKKGHSHGRALRGVADRLLGVACAMLRDQTTYRKTPLDVA